MIYVVKALARCCAKNSMPPRHQTLHTAKNHRRTKCKPTAIEAEHQTPDCTHQMQTSRTCLVFGIFRQILVWFLFSRCCTWNLYTFVTVQSGERLYLLQRVPHTLTSGKGQRLNRPRGDPLRQLSRDAVLSVRVCLGLRRQWHHLLKTVGSQTDEVIDWPLRETVRQQTVRGDGCLRKKYGRETESEKLKE